MLDKWKIFLILGCSLALASGDGYDGFKIYKITTDTQEQCDLLSRHKDLYDFFTLSRLPGEPARVMVSSDEQKSFEEFLRGNKLSFEVTNQNVGETVKQDFQVNRLLRQMISVSDRERLSTERYYSHGEINNYIEDLAQRHPERVFVKQVGKSYEGRLIKTITITNGDRRANKNVIFMDGGFHAREWISPAAVLYVIDQLVDNSSMNSDLLLDYDWVIIPVVNPDGYEYTQQSAATRFWRKTRKPYLNETSNTICYGADPNRNFDFHWNEEGASPLYCMDTFAGPTPFSEPETVIVRDIMHSLRGRGMMYLTIHSYGNYLLYPWGWTEDLPETWEDLDEVATAGGDAIRQETGTVYKVGSSTRVLYIAAGASDDYGFHIGFPISITMELPGGGDRGFDPPPSSIDPYVKETWTGIRAMAKKVVQKYPLTGV